MLRKVASGSGMHSSIDRDVGDGVPKEKDITK
jgi:hypothetical protein